jgi:hypothetical protein
VVSYPSGSSNPLLHLLHLLHLLRRVGNNNYPQVCSPHKLAQAVGS